MPAELYNKTDKYSIEAYGQGMVGKTFRDICIANGHETVKRWENPRKKGSLGELVEVEYFHYETNNNPAPDFKEAGVELKSAAYLIDANHETSAKERLVLTMIDYMTVAEETVFEKSHLWYKSQWLLLVFYLYIKGVNKLDFEIDYVRLFTPPEQDLIQIKKDYLKIVTKIREGRAHELSEADTMYLSASTKSSNSSVRRKQPYSDIPAKPRAFSYKVSYMTYVFNTYVKGRKPLYESIIKNIQKENIEDYVVRQINRFKGKTVTELCRILDISFTKKPKNLGAMIVYRILGIKGNKAEEFVKAGIEVKTCSIEPSQLSIQENVSFPAFKFLDILKQEWETSDLFNQLSTTRYLFVIFQKVVNGDMYLKGCRFWNMPMTDIEEYVQPMWQRTKYVLEHIDEIRDIHNGKTYIGIFPKQSENPVCHVRPHGRDSRDQYPLPDGRMYPKQGFWLNNSYILSEIIDN